LITPPPLLPIWREDAFSKLQNVGVMHRKSVLRTFKIVNKYAIKVHFTPKLCRKKKSLFKNPKFISTLVVFSTQPKAGEKIKTCIFSYLFFFAIKKPH
jgi:hypothetical protein